MRVWNKPLNDTIDESLVPTNRTREDEAQFFGPMLELMLAETSSDIALIARTSSAGDVQRAEVVACRTRSGVSPLFEPETLARLAAEVCLSKETTGTLRSFGHYAASVLQAGSEGVGVAMLARLGPAYTRELLRAGMPILKVIARALTSFDLEKRNLALQRELDVRQQHLDYVLAERGRGGAFDWDLQGNSIFLSQEWKRMVGFDEGGSREASAAWTGRIHPDDFHAACEAVNSYLSGRSDTYVDEYRLRHRDGSWRQIRAGGVIVEWTSEGVPTRFVGVQTDVTDSARLPE